MKKKTLILSLAAALLALSFANNCDDWGFFGHRKINKMAVLILPPELITFFKPNIDYLTEHAVDPDKRRYASKYEAIRHYINPDEIDVYPFERLPRKWTEALAKFTDVYGITEAGDTLLLFGESQFTFDKRNLTLHGAHLQRITGEDTLVMSKWTYLKFAQQHFLRQYYEAEWLIEPLQIDSLLLETGINLPLQTSFKKVFAIDRISQYGIVPWHLQTMQARLTKAFEEKDLNNILRIAADFGHYIADAHVPLHTTQNYNGQLTNQYGIHGFWETRLPELYADETYSFLVGKAEYIEDPTEYYWNIVLESHRLVDSVLLIERNLRASFPEDQVFCYENLGKMTVRTFCTDYAEAYHEALQGMVEIRMRAAIKAVGSAWFSAWIDAGQPDLSPLKGKKLVFSETEKKEKEAQEKAFRLGKIFGQEHEN